ncbi:N-acyl homoserine lactonase [Serratia marcescens]|uniref:N-acyl homoserine lactonase n=1 Tax=Serratia TaxID=613 RepID=UPI0018D91D20|nr:N-acyl homoserine lactonase [Serratia marcescens]MBH2524518.1 N-acyl homoserine lactonase [Serratia marcescens]MBH2894951.1 N-acyl homoserine lactonase [Serratia marcescens]MBH2909378.1 N-acyl homoserine lactonase [Serratia marcescens]MBH2914226.1 N-acyl homoserine lactonase [Serratia marcescens]MDH2272215.1 N-acyl homoserine lactonase [Serratia marcescens]
MQKKFSLLGLAFFSAHVLATPESVVSKGAGDNIAKILTAQYNNTTKDCGNEASPAFLCSGIMLRGTTHSTDYKFWQPSPLSIKNGGVSFSYLRKDAKFKRLAYGYKNGFIIHPSVQIPDGRVDFPVLCAFPVDSYTNERSEHGCGENVRRGGGKGKPCDEQGVTTADDWIKNYRKEGGQDFYQCGYNVTLNTDKPAVNFFQMLESIKKIPHAPNIPPKQNEIRISTWSETEPSKLPIEALFYSENSGLADAQKDQRDYERATGHFIPIVKILLPRTLNENALFKYNPKDQVVLA